MIQLLITSLPCPSSPVAGFEMGAKAIDDGSIWLPKLEGCSLLLATDQLENFVAIDKDFFPKRQTTKKNTPARYQRPSPVKIGMGWITCLAYNSHAFTCFTYPSKDAPDVAAN